MVKAFSAYADPLFLLFVTICIATNVLWYRIKFVLRDRGFPISYIHHFQDITHLNQLIETSPSDLPRLRRLRTALFFSFAMTLAAFGLFFVVGLRGAPR